MKRPLSFNHYLLTFIYPLLLSDSAAILRTFCFFFNA